MFNLFFKKSLFELKAFKHRFKSLNKSFKTSPNCLKFKYIDEIHFHTNVAFKLFHLGYFPYLTCWFNMFYWLLPIKTPFFVSFNFLFLVNIQKKKEKFSINCKNNLKNFINFKVFGFLLLYQNKKTLISLDKHVLPS